MSPLRSVCARVATALLLTSVLAACSTQAQPRQGVTSVIDTAGGETTAAGQFPVMVTRSGGIAGFADKVQLSADGAVTGTVGKTVVSCRVPLAVAGTLAKGAAQNLRTPDHQTHPASDSMSITITSAAGNSAIGDGTGTDEFTQAAVELLGDLHAAPGSRALCR